MRKPLLEVKDLQIKFETKRGTIAVSDGVSFAIGENETLCLVGESGCGKSVVAVSIMGLLPAHARVAGEIRYREADLLQCSPGEWSRFRGREIAMIFEQPMSCLNPVISAGRQIAEAYAANNRCSKREALAEARRKLDEVGIPENCFVKFPHELSGGMQQRVMIAIALACRPNLLIADEPTAALDVTVQCQILELLHCLKDRYRMSMLLITHDLGVVAEMADTVGVMYAGTMMELSGVEDFFYRPGHPYSRALMNVVAGNALSPIRGSVPHLLEPVPGCPFHARCVDAVEQCRRARPQPRIVNGRMERCHHFTGDNSGRQLDQMVSSR